MDRGKMEQIIANLLVADNAANQKAIADLQEAFKTPEAIPALCEVMVSSTEAQHRKYASDVLKDPQQAIPYIVKALQGFATQDPEQFIEAFDSLEIITDSTPKSLLANWKLFIDFCLDLANNAQLGKTVRIRAVTYIGSLVCIKNEGILEQNLVEPIIKVVFSLMATAPEDGNGDGDEDYCLDVSNTKTSVLYTFNQLAIHIPPEKLIPPLLALLDPALKSGNTLYKKAVYLSIASITKGCSESICRKYLRPLLDCVKVGITEQDPIVRNAAFFALCQFFEYLQPEVSKYASEILPILFQFLQRICVELRESKPEPKLTVRVFYALETFCENLEDSIVPYLPTLMERLFETLNPKNSVKLRELSLSCVASAATAAKTNMLPYFPQLIEGLKMYLVQTDDEDIISLRPHAIKTLATLTRNIGKENFMPFANDTMTFALTLLDEAGNDETELRSSLYNLLAALSEVLTVEMATFLPKIVGRMLDSVKSSEEVVTEFKENDEVLNNVNEGGERNADEIDIENSEEDEKKEAILALKVLAELTGPAFAPYTQPCFEAIYIHLDHPLSSIRKVAIEALTQFAISSFELNDLAGSQTAVAIIIPKFAELLKTDNEINVPIRVFEAYMQILKEMKSHAVFNEELKNHIFSCISDVMSSKVACQYNGSPGVEREHIANLIEEAGQLFPIFGGAMQPHEFALYFDRFLPLIQEKYEEDEELDRSQVYFTLAESFPRLQAYTRIWFDALLPRFMSAMQDECEPRQCAVFALGELVSYAGEKAFDKYPQVLQALSEVFANEEDADVLDNGCGAIARLIIANSKLIPMEQILPLLVQQLPLEKDFCENKAVFKSMQALLAQNNEVLLKLLDRVILIALGVLARNECGDDETREVIVGLLKESHTRFADVFNQAIASDPDAAKFYQTL